ncbi:MarR family transcriptional regulator [Haloechinothrix sp. LS1_15]|uniref:MarR family winged helix-turn-helix transcriptional regulator n=1 Tax=Haloechinothrix sp. LS1_15 TaxID=2652248 RepID=UPI00294499B0|nr:MarR family transcriptional regulator [Haloechinothrix sp. LS1_15]MDV6011165.1 MarR family transcriptional regulator [Haloechinothrix sp. LS1_15]
MASTAQQASNHEDLDTADALGTQLIRFVRLLNRATAQLAKAQPDGIEQGTFAILGTLVRSGPQRTSALAELLHTEISTVSRQTGVLVQHGLLQRQADPDDGRACLLAPTDKGLRVYEGARAARNRWLAATVREWDPADVEHLIRLLDRLNSDLLDNDLNAVPLVDGADRPATSGEAGGGNDR